MGNNYKKHITRINFSKEANTETTCELCKKSYASFDSLRKHLQQNKEHDLTGILQRNKPNTASEASQSSSIYNYPNALNNNHHEAQFCSIQEYSSEEDSRNKVYETNPHSEEETIHQIFDYYFPDDSSVPEEETEEVNPNLSNDNDYPDILSRMQALLNFNCNDGSLADFNMNHFIDSSIPEALHNDLEEEAGIKNVCDPFRNMLELVLIAFFDGCSINIGGKDKA
ncbi:hypothetical protein BD408DRAFT_437825 [Parasitella parasitica]|nr:hypothetical protein BD408DRAFT_437825 [Parasitella parasitica]